VPYYRVIGLASARLEDYEGIVKPSPGRRPGEQGGHISYRLPVRPEGSQGQAKGDVRAIATVSRARNQSKGGLMPLTTAQIHAKLGVEEDQPLYLLALVSDEDGSFQGYGATLPEWVDGEEVATEHGRVLYVFTSPEKAEEFANKTRGHDPDPLYPKMVYDCSDWGWLPDEGPVHVEAEVADLRDIAYAVAYFSHHHTLAIDAGPIGEGRYIPLEDLGWSRELVEVYRAFPAATHLDRFFGETADEAERDFREGRAVDNHGILRLPAHLFESADEDSRRGD
jgi:hypothetical protein